MLGYRCDFQELAPRDAQIPVENIIIALLMFVPA